MTFGVLQSSVSATGEEIGWRGFFVPVLAQRLNFTGIVLVSGLVWALWHFPLIVFGTYTSSAPKWVALVCLSVMIIATGVLAAWLRLKTGSVWPAVMLHVCHNALIQWLFDLMTVETGRAAWFSGEFGIALAVISALFAIPFWRNGMTALTDMTADISEVRESPLTPRFGVPAIFPKGIPHTPHTGARLHLFKSTCPWLRR